MSKFVKRKYEREPDPTATEVTGRIIYRMKRPKAKSIMVFTEDPEDPWFIYEYTLESKSLKVKNRSIFIAKDLPNLINIYQYNDWVLERVETPLHERAII
jgi:hypothetical protein